MCDLTETFFVIRNKIEYVLYCVTKMKFVLLSVTKMKCVLLSVTLTAKFNGNTLYL